MQQSNYNYIVYKKIRMNETLKLILQFVFSIFVTITTAILNTCVFGLSIETICTLSVISCLILCILSIKKYIKANSRINKKTLNFIISMWFYVFNGLILSTNKNYDNVSVLIFSIAIMSVLLTIIFGITCVNGKIKYIFLLGLIGIIVSFEIFIYKYLLVDIFKIPDLYLIFDFILFKIIKSLSLVFSVVAIFYSLEKIKAKDFYKEVALLLIYIAFFTGINSILGVKFKIVFAIVMIILGVLLLCYTNLINKGIELCKRTC